VKSSLLYHRSVSGFATGVDVENGVVTLRGEADSQAQIDLATEYARDIDGVEKVNNEMTVVEDPPKAEKKTMGKRMGDAGEEIDDASTTALVKSTLLHHRSTSGLNTKVETNEGVVTLTGKANNAAEMVLAAKLASDVHGVRKVVNDMTVD
jgi:hyperosmotically inducible periplasmic protein